MSVQRIHGKQAYIVVAPRAKSSLVIQLEAYKRPDNAIGSICLRSNSKPVLILTGTRLGQVWCMTPSSRLCPAIGHSQSAVAGHDSRVGDL